MNVRNIALPISFLCSMLLACAQDEVEQYASGRYQCVVYPTEYTLTDNTTKGSVVFIRQQLDGDKAVWYSFGNKQYSPNRHFDLRDISVVPHGIDDILSVFQGKYRVFGHSTDNILPLRVAAVDNADGAFPASEAEYFTGGFHGFQNNTSATAKPTMLETSKTVMADNRIVDSGQQVYCDSVSILVKNLIQACNTEKPDGSGRYVIQQDINVLFKNDTAFVEVVFVPLEDVDIYQIDGLGFFNDFPDVEFIGSVSDTGVYPNNVVSRADRNVKAIRQADDTYQFDVFVDPSYGIGNLEYNYDSYNAQITEVQKSYFHLLGEHAVRFHKGDSIVLRGGYVFSKKKATGIKPLPDSSLSTSSGIENRAGVTLFNLAGQRKNKKKGIVVANGKKVYFK